MCLFGRKKTETAGFIVQTKTNTTNKDLSLRGLLKSLTMKHIEMEQKACNGEVVGSFRGIEWHLRCKRCGAERRVDLGTGYHENTRLILTNFLSDSKEKEIVLTA